MTRRMLHLHVVLFLFGASVRAQPPELPLEADPSPHASKVTIAGRTMSNSTFRLSFSYEPGLSVREKLGAGGFERLTFLVYSRPSGSLLALVDCGGRKAETAVRAKKLDALTVTRLAWSEPLRATVHLPRPPETDASISVELLGFGRRARVLRARPPSLDDFTASSLFREISLLESGEPIEEEG